MIAMYDASDVMISVDKLPRSPRRSSSIQPLSPRLLRGCCEPGLATRSRRGLKPRVALSGRERRHRHAPPSHGDRHRGRLLPDASKICGRRSCGGRTATSRRCARVRGRGHDHVSGLGSRMEGSRRPFDDARSCQGARRRDAIQVAIRSPTGSLSSSLLRIVRTLFCWISRVLSLNRTAGRAGGAGMAHADGR